MVHPNLIAITYLIANHNLDQLADRDLFDDRESRGVVHTLPIAIACSGHLKRDRDHISDH